VILPLVLVVLVTYGGGLDPGTYVDFGTGFAIFCFRSGASVSPCAIPGNLGGGGRNGRCAVCAVCTGGVAFGGGAENCCSFCCGAGLCATFGIGFCAVICKVGYSIGEGVGGGVILVVHSISSPWSSIGFSSGFGSTPSGGKFLYMASCLILSSYFLVVSSRFRLFLSFFVSGGGGACCATRVASYCLFDSSTANFSICSLVGFLSSCFLCCTCSILYLLYTFVFGFGITVPGGGTTQCLELQSGDCIAIDLPCG